MAIIRTWSGDGLTPGPLTDTTAGIGDNPFSAVVGSLTVTNAGDRSPAIAYPDTAAVKRVHWWPLPGAPLTTYAFRYYTHMDALPATWTNLITGRNGDRWGIRMSATGQLIARDDATGTILWTSTETLPTQTLVRIELVVTGGQMSLYAYTGHTNTAITSQTGLTLSAPDIEEFWIGANSSVATTGWWMDDIAVSNEAALIGPAAEPPASYPPRYRYDGTVWVPLGNTHLISD